MKTLRVLLAVCITLFSAISTPAADDEPSESYNEDYIKALYLINLSQFVSWENTEQHLEICVVGGAELNAQLFQISKNTGLSNVLAIKSRESSSDLKSCNIVYISQTAELEIQQILYKVSTYPILTVSDIKDFINQDGMVGLSSINNTIKIEINNTLLKKKGISADPELLEIARRVI